MQVYDLDKWVQLSCQSKVKLECGSEFNASLQKNIDDKGQTASPSPVPPSKWLLLTPAMLEDPEDTRTRTS